jgi:hypothetical protein
MALDLEALALSIAGMAVKHLAMAVSFAVTALSLAGTAVKFAGMDLNLTAVAGKLAKPRSGLAWGVPICPLLPRNRNQRAVRAADVTAAGLGHAAFGIRVPPMPHFGG